MHCVTFFLGMRPCKIKVGDFPLLPKIILRKLITQSSKTRIQLSGLEPGCLSGESRVSLFKKAAISSMKLRRKGSLVFDIL
jgi:hypothetical protein